MRETSPTPIRVSPRRVRDRFPITLFHIPADPVPPEARSVKTVHFLAYSRTDLHHPPRALPGTPAPRPVCALVPFNCIEPPFDSRVFRARRSSGALHSGARERERLCNFF